MTTINDVIDLAKAEVGYREKASNDRLDDKYANAGSGNFTKYARDLDSIPGFYNGKKQGYAWCDVFVDWLFYKTFGASKAKVMLYQPDSSAGAGCTYSLGYFRQNGAFYTTPAVGDQIFFGSVSASNHTGIVYQLDSSYVYTIEGNSSDGVNTRKYSRNSNSIAGYGRPKWSVIGEEIPETPVSINTEPRSYQRCTVTGVPLIKDNSCDGASVRALQALLNASFDAGLAVDGEWGPNTKNALMSFQAASELESDGECGPLTWHKLLGGD